MINKGPVLTAPFLYKHVDKNVRFCQSVHTDLHKTAQKRGFRKRHEKWMSTEKEVFENALCQYEGTKTEFF